MTEAPAIDAPGADRPVDILFWVQHLLGIGHLTRAATLVRGMRKAGLTVTLVSGGLPIGDLELAGAELVQLEPVQSDGIDFRLLLDDAGRPVDEAFKDRRRKALLAAFHARRPRIVMTELFPFGRRQMRFELEPLLHAIEAASPRPALVCSVRDILVKPPRAERLDEMLTTAMAYDRILVHGDPALISFAHTFPARDRLGDRLVQTGYVVEPLPAVEEAGGEADGRGEILVSTGGGRVGERLIEVALAASALLPAGPPWRILAGQHLPEPVFQGLVARARPGVVVERARPDFRQLLGRAALSISQGGYNTVIETLAAGCRAIVVPYADGLETEQTLRCQLLAERGLLHVMTEATLDAASLAAAVGAVLASSPPVASAPRMDGTENTVGLLKALLRLP